jgi:hypothetical protein
MNRRRLIAALSPLLACAAAVAQESYLWSFDRDPIGRAPSYLLADSNWAVAVDSGAPTQPNVLTANATGLTNALGSVCAVQGFKLEQGRLWTRLNVFSGAAGLVFRMRSADNFDVLMVTPDGSRLQLMTVRNGVAQELASSVLKTTFGRWHRMGVELDGRTIGCYFDGELRMTAAEDPMSAGKGAIGLIVAGGGRAHFDDLNVDVTTAAEPARRAETVVQILLAENRIALGDAVVTLRELTDRLTQRFDNSQRLLLLVDKNMDYERVEQVLKAAVSVGFEKISIELRK